MKKIALVDVSAMYFRAYYAIRSLTNSKGMPTNAIYGFLTMNLKFLEKFKPDYLVYCFDQKDPSFRKEIYEAYKANRSEMPEDLVPQVPYITKVAKALGGACSELKGYEADDIIGMIASWSKNHEVETLIVSGDKDFAQLVDTNVHMYDPVKELYYKEVDVVDKWGVEPNQIIDYLSLVGDSSDNIPGVRGVGPKGAEKLLKEYKNLDNIFANISKIKNKNLATKLSEGKEQAYIAQKLVSIVREDKLGLNSLKDFEWTGLNHSDLKDLLLELDFKSLHKKLYETNSKEKPSKTKEKVKFTIKT